MTQESGEEKGIICSRPKPEEEVSLVAQLKACTKQKDLRRGRILHARILKKGLFDKNIHIGNTLLNLYAKCGALEEAQDVFESLRIHDVVSWNALITGYAQNGSSKNAFICLEGMKQEGLSPDAVTFSSLFKACGTLGAVSKGNELHNMIIAKGLLEKDSILGSALVSMYARCGAMEKAQEVVDELLDQSVVSWTALITGYAQHGLAEKALSCFEQMQNKGISPNEITFICALKACSSLEAADKGDYIHDQIVKEGWLEKDIMVGNALVDVYAKCGALDVAQEVFDKLPTRNVVSWNTLIIGYAEHGHGLEALNCIEQMQVEGLSPDDITVVFSLKACACMGALFKGKDIHAEIVRHGWLGKSILIGNALVDMYATCGALGKAKEVLDLLQVRNVISWTALIAGYVQHGYAKEALDCFQRMQGDGVFPDVVALVCMLKACGSLGRDVMGKEIHAWIVRELYGKSTLIDTALLDMYSRCGELLKAQEVFDDLEFRDIVPWNVLIAGYVQHDQCDDALLHFEQMCLEGLSPSAATFACALKACGSTGAIDKGDEIHAEVVRQRLIESDLLLGNALVDMYAKCGAFEKALKALDMLPVQDIVTWNSLIAGYSQYGCAADVLYCFKHMQIQGFSIDAITFRVVLNACCHSGLVEKGQSYFESMSNSHRILPTLEHYACMVDLYSRAGHFNKALHVIKKMPTFDYLPAWSALLGACRLWGNVDLGRLAFDHAVELDSKDSAAYISMRSIYLASSLYEDADEIEAMMVENAVW